MSLALSEGLLKEYQLLRDRGCINPMQHIEVLRWRRDG